MGRHAIETVMGAAVLIVAGVFVYFAINTAQIGTMAGYEVKAAFYTIGGLSKGSDVRLSGVKVGTVVDAGLDPKNYDAMVTLRLAGNVRLPKDTVASITSSGMLGDKYVRLEPGKDTAMIADGGQITHTKDYRSLEDQVGEIIFLATGGASKSNP